MIIRSARTADAEALRDIYNLEVTTSTVTFDIEPRTLEDQEAWLEQRSGAHVVLVAERGREVIGFASLSPYKDRPGYRTSVESSVYIRRDCHGQGVGKALMNALVGTAREHGFHAMFARIVAGHVASIRLHEAVGFEIVGNEREVGRKFGKWLDVVVMELLL